MTDTTQALAMLRSHGYHEEAEHFASLVADIEERDRRIAAQERATVDLLNVDRITIAALRERCEGLRSALEAISKQALYEWGEKRESLCGIIDACRDVARAALVGEEK